MKKKLPTYIELNSYIDSDVRSSVYLTLGSSVFLLSYHLSKPKSLIITISKTKSSMFLITECWRLIHQSQYWYWCMPSVYEEEVTINSIGSSPSQSGYLLSVTSIFSLFPLSHLSLYLLTTIFYLSPSLVRYLLINHSSYLYQLSRY